MFSGVSAASVVATVLASQTGTWRPVDIMLESGFLNLLVGLRKAVQCLFDISHRKI